MTGTIINIITVLIGSSLGLLLRTRMNESYKTIILQGIGILTLVIGLQMAFKTENILLVLASLLLGAITGQWIRIDLQLEKLAEYLKKKFSSQNERYFSEGFITASIIFCVGPMTILGAINDGLSGDYELLAIKSVLDGFTSIALTASFGIGVMLSVITILVIQGGISFSAFFVENILTESIINEMTAVGGLIIIGIGLVILKISEIKVANFLPGLIYAPVIFLILNYLNLI